MTLPPWFKTWTPQVLGFLPLLNFTSTAYDVAVPHAFARVPLSEVLLDVFINQTFLRTAVSHGWIRRVATTHAHAAHRKKKKNWTAGGRFAALHRTPLPTPDSHTTASGIPHLRNAQ